MWQLYAQTAFDIVAQRQREARQAVADRRADASPDERPGPQGLVARAAAALGRAAGSLAGSSRARAGRLEGGRGNA
ncbi:MAG TPA: hypothetical protein VFK54_12150 [Candidatus Limnocylindrales bacterium]|nr:hypothetical protein [Candidatus Limnocylindrales bacterium]